MPPTPFWIINLPAVPFPAMIVEPVEYIDPSTSRLYVLAALPIPSLADAVEPNWNAVPTVVCMSPAQVIVPPNTALPVALARVNLSVAIAMSPLPVIDVTASIAPPIVIPVAVVAK